MDLSKDRHTPERTNEMSIYINEEVTCKVIICINITKLINCGSYCTSTVKNVVTSKGIEVGIECK